MTRAHHGYRRYLLLLPLCATAGVIAVLIGMHRTTEQHLRRVAGELVSQRLNIETITGIRRDTRRTYVTILERRLTHTSGQDVLDEPLSVALNAVLRKVEAFSAAPGSSGADRQLRTQLLKAETAWAAILDDASHLQVASVQTLRDDMSEIDRLAQAILKLNSDGARDNELGMEHLQQRAERLQLAVAALIILGGVVVLVWWLSDRARARLAAGERARHEQEQLTALLEAAVAERTVQLSGANQALRLQAADLATTNQALASEMHSRLQIEAELRQAQKLEALGRLAAGVAHEINTPVQFVSDSVHFSRDAVKDVFHVIEMLRLVQLSVLEGTPSSDAATAAADAAEAADLEYLAEHLPKALERALDGIGRVGSIVRSMKEFVHPDQTGMTSIDLNEAIQNTLTIASNEYKYVAVVETDLGDIPPVMCHVGELNQVILNIIVNAAHAIGDVVTGTDRGRIHVRTCLEGQDVVIAIADTGAGIPEEARGRVFDPFFTTKDVGKGTGQGLFIARSVIVEKHRGQLTFESEVGQGTSFFIRLPVDGHEARAAGDAAA